MSLAARLFTPVSLRPKRLEAVKTRMLYGNFLSRHSLTRQLGAFGLAPGSDWQPEVIVLTLNSAVPVADAIRGAHDAAGRTTPKIIGVKANRDLFRYFSSDLKPEVFTEEVERLKEELGDRTKAVLVDEYVEGGTALSLGRDLLKRAGIESCWSVIGSWYQGVESLEHLDIPNMTSVFATEMHDIGRLCYERYALGLEQNQTKNEQG
jgi:lipase chaperone LimK